ncbi:MAG: integrase core domain-containing protein, partial [Planctomyces sp.]
FIQTLKFECLNKFVIVAEKHLDHICRIWSCHYNEGRPHSSRDHLPPNLTAPPEEATTIRVSDIVCTSKLGGVIHSCSRRAAWSHRIQVQISNWAALNVRADWNFLRHSPLKPCIDSLDAATDR